MADEKENSPQFLTKYLEVADLLDKHLHNAKVLEKVKDDILVCGRGAYFEHEDGTLEYYDIIQNPKNIQP